MRFGFLLALLGAAACASPAASGLQVKVHYKPELAKTALDGRLLFIVAPKDGDAEEPRLRVDDSDTSAQIYGVDVEGWGSGDVTFPGAGFAGYPLSHLADLSPGDYTVQAVLHEYETFHRADGHVVKLPMDRGEGQQWALAPGNLVSTPQTVHVQPGGQTVNLELDHALPAIEIPADTKYLKHVKLKSELLSKFWGREMSLRALVLLPEGWDSHPDAHYPLIIVHGHFETHFSGWREEPPDEKLPPYDLDKLRSECPNDGSACAKYGSQRYAQEQRYKFFQKWTGPGFPRVILVEIQHANPYYDDSYAVNSENVGPYGDAITRELVPLLEKQYRGLGPWARGMYGGSTGGWETLAAQIFYPDDYNGAIANCPDSVDFRAHGTVNLYEDENAYEKRGPFRTTPRGSSRELDGTLRTTMAQDNHMELALGTRSRSGQQWDIWEAVFSPVGPDGYPKRIWDKETGQIDKSVAAYWREHYDLGHIVSRDWATLGPKLAGKLSINIGNMDSFFLDGGVRAFESRLAELAKPKPDVVIDYGTRDGHCWTGDHEHTNFESRFTTHARMIPLLVAHFLKTAPAGADVKSWRY